MVTYGDVFYPEYPTAIKIKRQASLNAVATSTKEFNSLVFVVAQKNYNAENIDIKKLNKIGTICELNIQKESKTIISASINPLKIVNGSGMDKSSIHPKNGACLILIEIERTLYKAKKTGICNKRGKHPEAGLIFSRL